MSWDNGDGGSPSFMSARELQLFTGVSDGDSRAYHDETLQLLYHEALFDFNITAAQRETSYDLMTEYLWDTYGIDFDEVMDWEAYREWYVQQQQ